MPNVTDSKSVVLETVPGVRIPPSPPFGVAKSLVSHQRAGMRTEFDVAKRRWGTAGDRAAMRHLPTNPSFSAIGVANH